MNKEITVTLTVGELQGLRWALRGRPILTDTVEQRAYIDELDQKLFEAVKQQ